MTDAQNPRVAVYIDFDNIVISRYNQFFGRGAFTNDRARNFAMNAKSPDEIPKKLDLAKVNLGAVLDYAAASGSIVLSRAYADWSAPANAGYQKQLVDRAVDLTQLFQVTAGGKNGADIRLAVDVVEDLLRLGDITHVVLVAGDSDYIALAQRAKRLGRFVIGIGVAGATSRALMAACDEFTDYDALPGVEAYVPPPRAANPPRTSGAKQPEPGTEAIADAVVIEPIDVTAPVYNSLKDDPDEPSVADRGTDLLVRALRVLHSKDEDEEWLAPGTVKNQMLRMDPAFKEKAIGFKTFSDFITGQSAVAELKPKSKSNERRIKLKDGV